jgi:hypothetical protein
LIPGRLLLIAPGHALNPTDGNLFICDLDTYASLDAMPEVQMLVAKCVDLTRFAQKAVERAQELRDRRNAKRLAASQ